MFLYMSARDNLLVDEPIIGLAPKICLEIAQVLRRLREEFGTTVLITEQNANFAMSWPNGCMFWNPARCEPLARRMNCVVTVV